MAKEKSCPCTIGCAVVLSMAVAIAAGYIPARRVRKIEPVIALGGNEFEL